MATEIERKFVVSEPPGADVLGPGRHLRQGYLAEEGDVEVRVRIDDSTGVAVLTVKGGRGLARVEVERPITMDEADGLWPFTAGRRIDKVRHGLMVGTHRVDLDLYAGPLAGLCTAEVEFESEAEAAVFVAPPWFGVEVTGDGRWGNASLARKGAPDR